MIRALSLAALVSLTAAAAHANAPSKLVCQLAAEGITVEARLGADAQLTADLRVYRGHGGAAVLTEIPKGEVDAIVDRKSKELRLVVDRVVDGLYKRVLFLRWQPSGTAMEVRPAALLAQDAARSLPARVSQDNVPCTIWK